LEETVTTETPWKCYAVTIRTPDGKLIVWERYAPEPTHLITGVMEAGNREWPMRAWAIADWKEVTPHAERKRA
jgi:hypothetical protein